MPYIVVAGLCQIATFLAIGDLLVRAWYLRNGWIDVDRERREGWRDRGAPFQTDFAARRVTRPGTRRDRPYALDRNVAP